MSDDVREVVRLDRVTRRFDDVVAVSDLTLTARTGDVLGLLGHNGAGKTTTLRLISGILGPSDGKVRIFDRDPQRDGREVRARTGVLLADPAVDRRLSGRENLQFVARLHGLDRDQAKARITELALAFTLDDRLDDRVEQYSDGMRQRLALARLLLPDPELLLLDEPTSTLDPMAAHGVRQLVSDLARAQSRTVVLSTHDLIEAAQICDRVAVLQRGALVALGTPEELAGRIGARGLRVESAREHHGVIVEIATGLGYASEPVDGALRLHGVAYDDVPQLVRDLVAADVDLYNVGIEQPTLTDFYLALHDPTRSDGDPARSGGRQ